MSNTIIVTIVIVSFVTMVIISSMIIEPLAMLLAFRVQPKTFRLHKPKNDNNYYLQVRLFFIYYYVYRTLDDYNITLHLDKFCLNYPNHIIISKRKMIFDDRYKVIKFFSDMSNPSDNINL